MKKLMAVVLVLVQSVIAGESFAEKFAELNKGGDSAEMRKFIEQAAEAASANADYYALVGAWWWQESLKVNISTKPSEEGDFSVRDPESGEEVGSISSAGKANPELTTKAVATLAEGVRRFPARADIALGLAHVQKELGADEKCVEVLLALLATACKDPAALTWTNNEPPPKPAATFLPEALQGYTVPLFRKDSPETDALCAKLCTAITKAFPEHPFAYIIQAALADARGDQAEALRLLEVASSKAPDDALIQLNVGDACRQAGKKEKALEAYRKVLSLEVEEGLKEKAGKAIREVEGESGDRSKPGGS